MLSEVARPIIGACSLAVGADQVFAEEVLAAGGSLHIIVPALDYESTFSRHSLVRFQQLLAIAATVEVLDFETSSEEAFLAAGRRVVELADVMLAVWDGQPARGLGGTADIVAYAKKRGVRVQVVWPTGLVR